MIPSLFAHSQTSTLTSDSQRHPLATITRAPPTIAQSQKPQTGPSFENAREFSQRVKSTCPSCRDSFNLSIRLPVKLPCNHVVCLFCLTFVGKPHLAPDFVLPLEKHGIGLSCPECFAQFPGVHTSELPFDSDIVSTIQEINTSLLQR